MADPDENTGLLSGSGKKEPGGTFAPGGFDNLAHVDAPVVAPSRAIGAHKPKLKRQLSLANVQEAVTLSWRNLNAYVMPPTRRCCNKEKDPVPPKQILTDVNGIIHPGTLLAVMGASGAGKSTFMNVLTWRNLDDLSIDGEVLVNGEELGSGISRVSAYVQQDDLFIGTLTVKEHLWFQANLRLPQKTSKFDIDARVHQVMGELGLHKCGDSQIGVPGSKKSISGGERKRLAFASEILNNPALMFCDEPTSGLDSFMAMSVVQNLKNMAEKGKTILCTIHQPSSEVFALFDNLLLLAGGQVAFQGTTQEALEFFNTVKYPCPRNFNPADHYIYTLAIIPGKEQECWNKVNGIVTTYQKSPEYKAVLQEVFEKDQKDEDFTELIERWKHGNPYITTWSKQFKLNLWRSTLSNTRDPMIFRGRLIQAVITGVFLATCYWQQSYDNKGVMNINGALFLLQIAASLANMFAVIVTFPLEFPLFKREHHNGMYRVDNYFMAKNVADLPTFIIMPVVLMSVVYWAIGLWDDFDAFLIATAALVVVSNVAVSFGYLMSTISSNLTFMLALAPMIMVPLMLFGGLFMNPDSIPDYFIWLQYLSWFNYCNEILVVNQWEDVDSLECDSDPDSGICYEDGQAVIDSLTYDNDNIPFDFAMLCVLLVAFRIMAFIIMYMRVRKPKSKF